MSIKKTIYVGFDGTLCVDKGIHPGAPIYPMVVRVRRWVQDGHTVKIFTSRLDQETAQAERINVRIITDWCEREGLVNLDGSALVITNRKGRDCDEFWDDRAVSVNEYGNYTSMRKTAAALDATVEDTVKSMTEYAQAAYQKHLQTGAIQQGERPLTGSQTATPGFVSATNAVYQQRQAVPPSAPLEQDFGGQLAEAPLGMTFGFGYSHTPGTTACYCLDSLNVVCDMHRNDPPDPRTR